MTLPQYSKDVHRLADLARDGDTKALRRLIRTLHEGEYWNVMVAAARALGTVGGRDEAVIALISTMCTHNDAEIIVAANQSLVDLLKVHGGEVSKDLLVEVRNLRDRGPLSYHMRYANDDSPRKTLETVTIVFDEVRLLASHEMNRRGP